MASRATLRRAAVLTGLTLGVLVLVASVALAGLRLAHRGRILPGVTIEQVDVGGLTAEEATESLAPLVAARSADPVTLVHDGERFEVTPGEVGFDIDLEATVEAALALGRGGGLADRTWHHVDAYWTPRAIELRTAIDDDAVGEVVAAISDRVDTEPFPGAVAANPVDLSVTTRPPRPGVAVDVSATATAIRDGLEAGGPIETDLPVDVLPTRVATADVEAVADRARRAIAEPLTLRTPAGELVLSPADLATLVALEEVEQDGTWTVELHVPEAAVEQLFTEHTASFQVSPVDATFLVDRAPETTLDVKGSTTWQPQPAVVPIEPSRPGSQFSAPLAAEQLSELLRDARRSAELRLEVVEADLTTEEARELGIDTLLATFTTYHACCQTRVTNIQRLADMVDATVVHPGEQFSINQISGERTCAKGFAPAGMILNGEIVDVCGGGVSQFGTTAFNAVFFAGLPIDAYKAHSFYISRYPMGREATLNYPSPDIDVRFTNDTEHGILVKTAYTGTSITVSLYGHSDVTEVTATHSAPFNHKPYPTRRKVNRGLPPGASVVTQSGDGGFTVHVDRVIRRRDGTEDDERFTTVYVPKPEIVEYNPDQPPPPPPSGDDPGGDDPGGGDQGGDPPPSEPSPSEPSPTEPSPTPSPGSGDGTGDGEPGGGGR